MIQPVQDIKSQLIALFEKMGEETGIKLLLADQSGVYPPEKVYNEYTITGVTTISRDTRTQSVTEDERDVNRVCEDQLELTIDISSVAGDAYAALEQNLSTVDWLLSLDEWYTQRYGVAVLPAGKQAETKSSVAFFDNESIGCRYTSSVRIRLSRITEYTVPRIREVVITRDEN